MIGQLSQRAGRATEGPAGGNEGRGVEPKGLPSETAADRFLLLQERLLGELGDGEAALPPRPR